MKANKIPEIKLNQLLVGGFVLVAVSLLVNLWPERAAKVNTPAPTMYCEEMVLPKAELSGEQLAKLLTVPEPSDRSKVQEIVKQPYCRMPSLSIRVGAITEREVYPLAFDPQTWLVILYEGDNYVGYGFKRF